VQFDEISLIDQQLIVGIVDAIGSLVNRLWLLRERRELLRHCLNHHQPRGYALEIIVCHLPSPLLLNRRLHALQNTTTQNEKEMINTPLIMYLSAERKAPTMLTPR
jgi:hypothetical protein